jgi:hypothetical protein
MSKSKARYEPSELDLEGAPRAFHYELQMFRLYMQFLELLRNPYSILFNRCIYNAVLEGVLLHVRNLLEFFTGNQPAKGSFDEDSIRAGHFVGKSNKNQDCWWSSSKLRYTKSRKTDINKSLSHLTFTRIREKYKWDDLPKIRAEIEAAYTEFLQLLPQEDRAEWPAPES